MNSRKGIYTHAKFSHLIVFDSLKGIDYTYWIVAQRNVHFVDTEIIGLHNLLILFGYA